MDAQRTFVWSYACWLCKLKQFLKHRFFQGSMVMQCEALLAHSSRIQGLSLSLDYCLCGVLYVIPMFAWVSFGLSSFLPTVWTYAGRWFGYCMLSCPKLECVSTGCPAMDWHPIWCEFFLLVASVLRMTSRSTVTMTRIKRLLMINEW